MKTPDLAIRLMAKVPHPSDQEGISQRIKLLIDDRFDARQADLLSKVKSQGEKFQAAALSKILSGKAEASIKQLRQIEKASRARFEWLISGQEPMYHPLGWTPPRFDLNREGEYLRAFVDRHKHLFTQTQLGDAMGISKGSVTDYFTSGTLKPKTRSSLLAALKTLANNPYLSEIEVFGPPEPIEISSISSRIVSEGAEVQSIKPYVDDDYPMMVVPILPEYARAGLDAPRYWEQPVETTVVRKAYIPTNLRKRKWWIIKVNGDSMQPLLQPGDEVLAYWLDQDEWPKVYNRIVIIQFADQVVIKRIKNNRLYTDKGLYLHSDNEEAETFFVPIEDIQHIWLAKKHFGDL